MQWPLGWLSDRYDRALLIRCFAFSLALAALPLAIMRQVPLEVLFIAGFFLFVGAVLPVPVGGGVFPTTTSRVIAGYR